MTQISALKHHQCKKPAVPKKILKIFQFILKTNKILKEQYLNTLI